MINHQIRETYLKGTSVGYGLSDVSQIVSAFNPLITAVSCKRNDLFRSFVSEK